VSILNRTKEKGKKRWKGILCLVAISHEYRDYLVSSETTFSSSIYVTVRRYLLVDTNPFNTELMALSM
jgi:hypothetical protein